MVPAAPALKDVADNEEYREALINADVAIADSAFMVLLWNWMERDSIPRLSGLKYLRALLLRDRRSRVRKYILGDGRTRKCRQESCLAAIQGIEVPPECVYHAPMYGGTIEDRQLIDNLEMLRPKHIVVTVGGGTQERLGLYLKRNLGLSACDSLHRCGDCVSERGPGEDSELG